MAAFPGSSFGDIESAEEERKRRFKEAQEKAAQANGATQGASAPAAIPPPSVVTDLPKPGPDQAPQIPTSAGGIVADVAAGAVGGDAKPLDFPDFHGGFDDRASSGGAIAASVLHNLERLLERDPQTAQEILDAAIASGSSRNVLNTLISRGPPIDPAAFGQPQGLQDIIGILRETGSEALGRGGPEALVGPELGGFDTPVEQQEFRRQQDLLIDQLMAASRGRGSSAAQLQLQAGQEAAIQQAQALAASQAGVSPALAARLAQQQAGLATREAGRQSAILRAQEQQAARGLLAQTLAQARGQDIDTRAQDIGLRAQDIGVAGTEAQLGQQAGLANVDAQLRQEALNQQLALEALTAAGRGEQFGAQSQQELQGLGTQSFLGLLNAALGQSTADVARSAALIQAEKNRQAALTNALVGGGLAAAGQIGSAFLLSPGGGGASSAGAAI